MLKETKLKFRKASIKDLPILIKMLANDKLGQYREEIQNPLPNEYVSAFQRIMQDDNQFLLVVENSQKEIIGTLQLSFIQYLTYKGGLRAQMEAVRIAENARAQGLGRKMIEWGIEVARKRGAHLIQLTCDKKRPESIGFYKKIGFLDTHAGMKMNLSIPRNTV